MESGARPGAAIASMAAHVQRLLYSKNRFVFGGFFLALPTPASTLKGP
jgi:hypothetical protein